MKVKALLAGLLLLATAITQAAIIADGISSVSGGAPAGAGETANITGGGDLFLVVYNETDGKTYVQNLETDFVAFKNTLSASSQTYPLDALGQNFLTAEGGVYQWAVFAGNDIRGFIGSPRIGFTSYGNVADWGLLTTAGLTGTADGFNPDQAIISSTINNNLAAGFISPANTGLRATGTNSAVFEPGDDADYSLKGNTLAAAQVFETNGTNAILGETSKFFFVTNDYLHTVGGVPKVTELGSFTLSSSSLNFAPAGGGGDAPDPELGTIDAFGDQAVGTTSAAKTVTLSNNGTGAYAIDSITTDGDFATTNDCNGSVAAGGSCSIQVTFAPTTAGVHNGTLTVTPASGDPLTRALSGTGIAPVNPVVLGTIDAFGDQAAGSTSDAKTVTLTNNGTEAYAITSIAADGDFDASSNCGDSLAAGASCNIEITFTPSGEGARTGTLTVTPASGTPLTLALSGTGIAATVDVVLGAFDPFASQIVGTASAAKTVTLTNNGAAAYAITSIGTGTGSEFAATSHCGDSLAAGASCNIDITFTPSAAGARTGTLTVTPASGAPLTLALSGTGTAAGEVVLGTIDAFASQSVGITSAAKTVSLTNNSATAYAIASIAATGDFAVTHDCGTSLASSANCSIQVTFTPVLAGARTGKLTVTPATGTALTLDLSGTGAIPANLAVTPTQLDFGAVKTGKKALLTVTLRNTGSDNLTVGSVTGPEAPFRKVKDPCSSKRLKPGKSCTVGYRFSPTDENTFSGTSIVSADGIEPVVVTLSGTTGTAGELAVEPSSPRDIGQGGQFSITGQEFTSVRGKVLVNRKPATIVVWTDTLIIAKAPAKLGAGGPYDIEVVRKGSKPTRTGQALVTVHGPQLASLSASSGARGSELTLGGQYFGSKKPKVIFKSMSSNRKKSASVKAFSDGELEVTVPRLPLDDYQVTVVNGAGTSEPQNFTVTAN